MSRKRSSRPTNKTSTHGTTEPVSKRSAYKPASRKGSSGPGSHGRSGSVVENPVGSPDILDHYTADETRSALRALYFHGKRLP